MTTTAIADIFCAVFIMILYVRNFSSGNLSKSNRLLNFALILMTATLLIDAGAYELVGPKYPVALRYFLNMLSFTSVCLNLIAFTYYEEALFAEKGAVSRWPFRILKLIEYFWMLCALYEYIAGHLVTYDAGGVEDVNYVYPTYITALNLLILILLPIITLINRRRIGKEMTLLLLLFNITPIFTSLLYSLAGVDFAYAFSAITLGLIAEFIQKKHNQEIKTEQQRQLQKALDEATLETKKNDILTDIINGVRFAYDISPDDEVIGAHYPQRSIDRFGEELNAYPMEWIEDLHPEDKERVYKGFMAAIYDHSGQTPYNEAFRLRSADGEYRWIRSGGNVIRKSDGSGELFGISVDITAQIEEEQKRLLLEEERKRAKQVENELIISKLRADSLAYIEDNDPDLDRALDFFGKRILEISGCDQVVYREPDGRRIVFNTPGIEDIPAEICARCPFAKFDTGVFGPDGTIHMNNSRLGCRGVTAPADCPVKSTFMQLVYTGGKLVGKLTVHYLRDFHTFSDDSIDIMKTVATYLGLLIGRVNEKKAEIARIEAESANKAKTEFLFSMSHDIRTPMNAILGYTDIGLRHVEDIGRSRESFLKIKSAGGHLLNLINDILEMSRIESGKIDLAENPMDIRTIAKNILYMGDALAGPKNIEMKLEIGELKNPYVYTDELHISEVMINLISNAVKYTPEGGRVTYSIEQISDVTDGKVNYRFVVADNGIGMSEEFQRHLFEAFSREQTSTVSKIEGTGLGLSIVRKIVDMTGGTIRVDSKQNVGSTFTVEIPFKVMDDAAIAAFKPEGHADEGTPEGLSFEGKRVLLVEDNEMNRDIASELLTEAGLSMETAENGEAALQAVTGRGIGYYDYILMDIQMPVMNGYEATAEIRKLPGGDRVPIIALSANAFEEDRRKSLDAGMNAHVAKPINVKELFAVMAKFG